MGPQFQRRARDGVLAHRAADRDIAGAGTATGGIDDDGSTGVQGGVQGGDIQGRGPRAQWREGRCRGDVAVGGGDGNVFRIDQPAAGLAEVGADVGDTVDVEPVAAGGLDETAIAAIGPATGLDSTARRHHQGVAGDDAHLAAVMHPAGGAGGADKAARLQGDVLGRRQHHPALGVHADGLGADLAGVADAPGEDLGRAALGQHPAQVEYLVLRGLDLEHHVAGVQAGDGDLLPGRQQQAPAIALDDAAVLDVRGDQQDLTVAAGLDVALVEDLAAGAVTLEVQAALEEVFVGHVQGGGDHAGGVDHRVRAEDDTAGVDQIYPAIGAQLAEDGRGVAAGDPVEHRAGAGWLQETGDLVEADAEGAPVDDGVRTVGNVHDPGPGDVDAGLAMDDARARGVPGHGPAQQAQQYHRNPLMISAHHRSLAPI